MKDFLAPPPVNFKKEIVEVEGKTYEVQYDGKRVTIEEVGKVNHFRQEKPPMFLLPLLFVVSMVIWILFMRFLWRHLF